MDENGFRQFLKRAGKKTHIIDGLVNQVQTVETYFNGQKQIPLEEVTPQLVRDYTETLDRKEKKAQMRSLTLYFKFTGNLPLAKLAGEIREAGIANTRRSFKLREFRGVNLDDVTKLEKLGIVTVDDMLVAGKTPQARQQLAEQTGIFSKSILELVKLSDLSRLGAIKSVRARLYYEAGLDTPEKFIQWEPEALRQMLVEFVESTSFEGIAPLPKEIRNAIATAKKLPQIVSY